MSWIGYIMVALQAPILLPSCSKQNTRKIPVVFRISPYTEKSWGLSGCIFNVVGVFSAWEELNRTRP